MVDDRLGVTMTEIVKARLSSMPHRGDRAGDLSVMRLLMVGGSGAEIMAAVATGGRQRGAPVRHVATLDGRPGRSCAPGKAPTCCCSTPAPTSAALIARLAAERICLPVVAYGVALHAPAGGGRDPGPAPRSSCRCRPMPS